jgi:hypothetical protein
MERVKLRLILPLLETFGSFRAYLLRPVNLAPEKTDKRWTAFSTFHGRTWPCAFWAHHEKGS